MADTSTFKVADYLDQTNLDVSSLKDGDDWVEAAKDGFQDHHANNPWWPKHWGEHVTVYRGCTDAGFGLKTSLHRCLDRGNLSKKISEKDLSDAENRMIKSAREGVFSAPEENSWGSNGLGLNMSSGELLAVLQHQECPTRFLDVSRSALVALYFACESNEQKDGRIFLVTLEGSSDPGEATKDWKSAHPWLDLGGRGNDSLPWPQSTTPRNGNRDWRQRVCLVAPGNLDPRITAQKGLFLVGGLPTKPIYDASSRATVPETQSTPKTLLRASELCQVSDLAIYFTTGTQRPHNHSFDAFARTIRIPANMKADIRNSLAKNEGIGRGSIYPDFAGFRRLAHQVAANSGKP